jgi:hypothetical protein
MHVHSEIKVLLVKQVPKDPREELLDNTHQHCLATTSHGTHTNLGSCIYSPSIIFTSTSQPKFDQILDLPSIVHMMAWQMMLAPSVA